MKKLLIVVIIAAAAWFGIQKFLMQAKDTAASKQGTLSPGEKALKQAEEEDKAK